MQLTKKERLRVYRALRHDLIDRSKIENSISGYCIILNRALFGLGLIKKATDCFWKNRKKRFQHPIQVLFPELWAERPRNYYRNGAYWWHPKNFTKRIEILTNIINSMQ